MKYSYEYKRNCVELYRQGKWPETPEGAKVKRFHNTIRTWVRIEDACGPEALQHQNQNKIWTAEEKYELVAKILAGASVNATAIAAGIATGLLYQWVRCYRMEGYQGLVAQQKGRPVGACTAHTAHTACTRGKVTIERILDFGIIQRFQFGGNIGIRRCICKSPLIFFLDVHLFQLSFLIRQGFVPPRGFRAQSYCNKSRCSSPCQQPASAVQQGRPALRSDPDVVR